MVVWVSSVSSQEGKSLPPHVCSECILPCPVPVVPQVSCDSESVHFMGFLMNGVRVFNKVAQVHTYKLEELKEA